MQTLPDSFTIGNAPLVMLFAVAYPQPAERIVGLPGWAHTDNYDITAKSAVPYPIEQLAAMLRALMADRFRLKVRTEMRDVDGYALVRLRPEAALGPRLRRPSQDCSKAAPITSLPPAGADGIIPCVSTGTRGELRFGWTTTEMLVQTLSRVAGRVVVDRTGLTGHFEIALSSADGNVPGDLRVSVFTAVQEQLGLKLEATRVPAEFLIVEHIERPDAN